MRLRKSFILALNILLHSKLRSWLTIIGIVIGVAAIVAIVSIGEGAQASVQASLGGLGADIITVSPGFSRAAGGFRVRGEEGGGAAATNAKNLTIRDVQIIKNIEGVAFVNGMVSGRASLTYLAQTASVSIQGVDTLAWKNMVTTELESGRYLDPGDANENVIVVGNRIATTTFKQQLVLNRVVTLYINNNPPRSFKIVGILKASGGFGGDDNSVFMPISAARAVLDEGNEKLDSISIKVSSVDLVSEVTNVTDAKLMISRHVTSRTKDYSVTSAQAMQERIASVTSTFTLFLAAIAAVSLLVGAVGIANTLFTSVLEKTREIGVMKAIGAKNKDIMIIFLINSGLVGLTGGILGIMLGAGISLILPNLLSGIGGFGVGRGGIKTLLPISLLVEAILVSVLTGMIAGAIPAYRASKLKPVDALRYE
jgi:putative ABC transport system permease protein